MPTTLISTDRIGIRCTIQMCLLLAACGRVNFDAQVDAPAIDVAASDTDGTGACEAVPCTGSTRTMSCGARCYATCNDVAAYTTAMQTCSAWGGTLAVITSQAETDCVVSMLDGEVWMGYQQAATAVSPADAWTWIDGTPSSYTYWSGGEPNDGDTVETGEEQCAELYRTGAFWNDTECAGMHATVCSR